MTISMTASATKGRWPVLALLVWLVLVLSFDLAAQAQLAGQSPVNDPHHVDGTSLGGTVDLSSRWLAQQGDDARWSDPHYDDAQWHVVVPGVPLARQGLKNVDWLWYRTHVRIPVAQHNLALLLTGFGGSGEVFVNGTRVDGWGTFRPGGDVRYVYKRTIFIPDSAEGASGDLTLAIRARVGRTARNGDDSAGGLAFGSLVLLGTSPVIQDAASLRGFRDLTSNAINLALVILVLLITVALALTLRNEVEYRTLAIALAAQGAYQSLVVYNLMSNMKITVLWAILYFGLQSAWWIALIEFVRMVLHLRRGRALLVYYLLIGALFPLLSIFVFFYRNPHLEESDPLSVALRLIVEVIGIPVVAGLPLLSLWVAWKRRNRDALLLSVPLLINASLEYYLFGIFILNLLHWTHINAAAAAYTPIRAFHVAWGEVVEFMFSVTLLLFLVVRTVQIARERAIAASELQAVKTLQRLLLARAQQVTPGYAVETVYRPAAEVGGDFFLVSPGPDGSIVAIVGDVSGKGLLAAMRVSLILGALNRESSRQPAEVLERLNHVLLGQGDVGFTTACCVRVEANGDFSFANAGHLNPYLDGRELEAPGMLPLGIKSGQTYSLLTGHLDPGQRLVLLSDGVVEARANRGELLGFEKLVELMRLTPEAIADAAQRFGQEDDITVLALALA